MKKRSLMLCLACLYLFSSCSDNDAELVFQTKESEKFFPLSESNYWIYERTRTNVDGTVDTFMDTSSIVGVEEIDDELYYQFESTNPLLFNYLVRDSSGYLITPNGTVVFSFDENYTGEQVNVVGGGGAGDVARFESIMEEEYIDVEVPAGIFNCRSYQTTVIDLTSNPMPMEDRTSYTQYNKEVGLVFYSVYYFSNPNPETMELVEYSIE